MFFNYSWLDSEIDDEFGSRRFNGQSDFVLNVGFIQDLPALGAAFGATYRKQGDAFGRIIGEEVTTSYGADLEVFIEKRFGDNFTVRLAGSEPAGWLEGRSLQQVRHHRRPERPRLRRVRT